MAIIKIVSPPIHPGGARGTYAHLKQAIDYILKPEKTLGGLYTGSQSCSCANALSEMIETKRQYGKEPNPTSEMYEKDRLAYHFVISWSPDEKISAETALEITNQFCAEYLADYEVVYSSHIDQEHMHAHIIFNSVNYKTGRKYHCPNGEWSRNLQVILDRLCKERGLHSLEDDTGISMQEYEKKLHRKQGDSIRTDIDRAIRECGSFEEFEQKMRKMGYEIAFGESRKYGIYMKLKGDDMKRFRRTYTLGADYTVEMIKFRIAAFHNPDVKVVGKVEQGEEETYAIGKRIYYGRIRYGTKNIYLRKQYARMYRLGILPNHGKRLEYREKMKRIKEIRRLECQLQVIANRDYNSIEDFETDISVQEEIVASLQAERTQLRMQRKPYEKMLAVYERLEELEGAWLLWKEGKVEFQKEAIEYEKLTQEVQNIPYTREELEEYLKGHGQRESGTGKKLREARKKWKVLQELKEEYFQVMQEYEPVEDAMLDEMRRYGAEPENEEIIPPREKKRRER